MSYEYYFLKKRFLNLSKKKIWFIDGTCATGKSTIVSSVKGLKLNNFISCKNINTHPSSSLGYVMSSLKIIRKKAKVNNTRIFDRRCDNNIIWKAIWMIIADFERKRKTMIDFQTYIDINESFVNKIIYKFILTNAMVLFINSISNTIFIIDSNVKNLQKRMKIRAKGTDLTRSKQRFYLEIQNYVYRKIHEHFPKSTYLFDVCNKQNKIIKRIVNVLNKEKRKDFTRYKTFICKKLSFKKLNNYKNKDVYKNEFLVTERFRPMFTKTFTN